ncbi:MAG: ferrochelatase [Alphaproteobacteria bacterium]|nr:ferrochelatase [Alphaproteobacteria bacterium]
MSKKIAVVLLNLGGPDSKAAIKPFLMNFFMDPNIIGLPIPFRCFLAAFIANKRSKREAGDSYGELGDKSPLLENSRAQGEALEKTLNAQNDGNEYKVFICMRYWHPMSPQVVREVRDWGGEKIVLLPLYPQFSTATTWSSLGVWNKAMYQAGMNTETSMICCYPFNEGFIKASARLINEQYQKALADGVKAEDIRFLFSAHGLPEKTIKGGDPYQYQCEETTERIVALLKSEYSIDNPDYWNCYQSRVGPLKWIDPSLDDALEQAAKDKKAVLIYPHSFTQEHVETLVELDIEYREMAEEKGIHHYYRARTVGDAPEYIDGLAKLVKDHMHRTDIAAEGLEILCPSGSKRCCMRAGSLEPALKQEVKKVA